MKLKMSALFGTVLLIGCSGTEKDGVDTQNRSGRATMLNPGDIFTSKLPDGRYTAIRVLRRSGKSLLVCTTEYLGQQRPKLDEPRLRTTLIQHRFVFKNEPALIWLEGMPPENFEYLGNVTPSKAEAQTECNRYGGSWSEPSGLEAFLEWRWLHDRVALEEEIRKENDERERSRRLPQKPKIMMAADEFWSIIDRLDWENEGDVTRCSRQPSRHSRLSQRRTFASSRNDSPSCFINWTQKPMPATSANNGFLYARCVVVANGRKFYEAALKDPTKMAKDLEFESLLYLAPRAYELKTGEDFGYSTGCSYESFSNAAGWRE